MKRIVITGAQGLLGWHSHVQLHAANCAARYKGDPLPYDIIAMNRPEFNDDSKLREAIRGADAILHFAGVNRGPEEAVSSGNPAIANRLVEHCKECGNDPHIVYANSIHSMGNTAYGRSKRLAGEKLDAFASRYTDLLLPHIFGECARPFYNNVTATLIHQIIESEPASVNPDGYVQLLYAGEVARVAINAVLSTITGRIKPNAYPISVPDLFAKLKGLHTSYQADIYPDLTDPIDLLLFNSYRCATYPDLWPRPFKLNTDNRGSLFEAVKDISGGQAFLSTTNPGIIRGDHFHLKKVERFVVVKGDALIRVRKVLSDKVWEYRVCGEKPVSVDMPTMHTHSIENVGDGELLTLFWTNEIFDPTNPDTFADKVMR